MRGNFKNRHQEHRQAQLIVDLDDVDPCACPAANPQTFSSEAGFQSFYAAELSRAKANGAIEGIDGVNGVSMKCLVIRVCGAVVTFCATMPSTALVQEHGIRNTIKRINIGIGALSQFLDDLH